MECVCVRGPIQEPPGDCVFVQPAAIGHPEYVISLAFCCSYLCTIYTFNYAELESGDLCQGH